MDMAACVGDGEKLILVRLVHDTCNFCSQVVRKIELLQRSQREVEAEIHEKAGGDEGKKDGAIGVDGATGRPDDGFGAAPFGRFGHGYFPSRTSLRATDCLSL